MRKEKIKPLIIASALALGTVSVSTSAAVKPKSISLKPATSIVDIGGKAKINVTSKPTKAKKTVTWSSSNKKIASVSSSGVVTGKKAGKVRITAKAKANKKVKKSITIKVKDLKATSVKLNKTSISNHYFCSGTEKYQLSAKVYGPKGFYNQGVVWTSSNPDIARVNSKGLVKFNSKTGTVTITARERGGTKSAKCVITVDTNGYSYISKEAVKKDILDGDENCTIIDLRQPDQYKKGHITNSLNAPTLTNAAWDPYNAEKCFLSDQQAAKNLSSVIGKIKVPEDPSQKKIVFVCPGGGGGAQNAIRVVRQKNLMGKIEKNNMTKYGQIVILEGGYMNFCKK